MINPIDVRTSADQILMLERGALDRCGKGDPSGFLELYAADITYFDPVTATRIDGHQAMVNYYRPWVGKIQIARYEMLNLSSKTAHHPPASRSLRQNGFSTKPAVALTIRATLSPRRAAQAGR